MGAYIIAAEEDEVFSVGEADDPLEQWSGMAKPGFGIDKLVMLHCLLTGEEFSVAECACDPHYVSPAGAAVAKLSDELVLRLAGLDEAELLQVATELAASEPFEDDHWTADDAEAMLAELAELSARAESQGQVVFIRFGAPER